MCRSRRAERLLESLRGRVTGLAWPTYVLDIPGGHGKVPIGPDYRLDGGAVRDICGGEHRVRPAQIPHAPAASDN